MLATKKWVAELSTLAWAVLGLAFLNGCTPTGPASLLEGERLRLEGQLAPALEALERATTLLPTNALAWNSLGLTYHQAGQVTNAVRAYRQCLSLARNRDLSVAAAGHYNLGCLYLEQNRTSAALDEFKSFTMLQPRSADGWLKLGTAEIRERQFDVAERSFATLRQLKPHSPEAFNALGMIEVYRRRPAEAATYFTAALKEQPNYPPALLNMAIVEDRYLNHRLRAYQDYRRYLGLHPSSATADSVQLIVRRLETELFPAPRLHPTNLVTSATTITNRPPTPTNTLQTLISPPVAPLKTSSVPAILAQARPAATREPAPKVTVVELPPEPLPRPVRDIASRAPKSVASTPANSAPPTPLILEPAPPTLESPAVTSKTRRVLEKMNPKNWFRDDGKARLGPTPLPAQNTSAPPMPVGPSPPAQDSHTNAVTTVDPLIPAAPRPTILRYAYQSPAKPKAGDRRGADRYFRIGAEAQQQHRLAAALTAYQKATESDPAFFEAHYNLGLAAFETHNLPLSLAAYENALAIDPTSTEARYNFALALQKANYSRDAASQFQTILVNEPLDPRVHFLLANIYAQELYRPDLARQHYLKVLQLEPQHRQANAIRYWLAANP